MMFDDETTKTRDELNVRQSIDNDHDATDEAEVYPPTKVVIPAFLALALSFFVIALVRPNLLDYHGEFNGNDTVS